MSDHIYKSLELTGSSKVGIEDAVDKAIAKASETVRNIQWFNIVETRGRLPFDRLPHELKVEAWDAPMATGASAPPNRVHPIAVGTRLSDR